MSIFSRFTDIVNANLNSMLDKAEQPDKMIRLIIQEMEETLVEVRATAAKHIAEKKSLQRQIDSAEKRANNWQEKAELAMAKDREDLAKAALVEKHQASNKVEEFAKQMTEVDIYIQQIQQDSQRLQEKLAEAHKKQKALLLRQESACVRLKAKQTASVYDIEDAIAKFDRFEQKIEQVEAEIEAFDMTQNQDLDSQIDALAREDEIADELAELKKKVANG